MSKMQQNDSRMSDGVNLLISILVRYPEIGTIKYDANNNTIKFTFMLSGIVSEPDFAKAKRMVLDSIAAYHLLEGTRAEVNAVSLSACVDVTVLTILRDVASLSKGEITLVIALLRDNCNDRLIADENDAMQEEDLLVQEEVIDSMLENVKRQKNANGLIGIREDGRVLVFNQ
ncbi:MAG: hypothetical protein H6Q73_2524 [Firmicutes bacterium]|nr:hypothetical protein [Bacillota bacterium]